MATSRSGRWEDRDDFVGGITNEGVFTSDEPLTLHAVQEVARRLREHGYSVPEWIPEETSTINQKEYSERLKRKAENMYKYKFRFKGGGKRVDNMNFKFHCFIADSDAVEHHLFSAKEKGLIVQPPRAEHESYGDSHMYDSAMPIVKVFSSTGGFGIAKEYFSFFFLLNPASKKMVKIKPLGFNKTYVIDDWYFMAAGRFLKKEEIRKFFGHTSDTWKFYQRQSFLSKRRLLEMVEVGENNNVYDGDIINEVEKVRTIRMD